MEQLVQAGADREHCREQNGSAEKQGHESGPDEASRCLFLFHTFELNGYRLEKASSLLLVTP